MKSELHKSSKNYTPCSHITLHRNRLSWCIVYAIGCCARIDPLRSTNHCLCICATISRCYKLTEVLTHIGAPRWRRLASTTQPHTKSSSWPREQFSSFYSKPTFAHTWFPLNLLLIEPASVQVRARRIFTTISATEWERNDFTLCWLW